MQTVSSAMMRELDRRTIAAGTAGAVLMDRAGRAAAETAEIFAGARDCPGRPSPWILLLAGHGNNGGDAFAAARHLHARGRPVAVWLAATASQVKGHSRIHLERMINAGVPLLEMPAAEAWTRAGGWVQSGDRGQSGELNQPGAGFNGRPPAVIVDGLLGTGIAGAPQGVMAAAIEFVNRQHDLSRVVALDVPSGLNADDGTAAGASVRADCTITMALPKTGMLQPAALDFVGSLAVADIGIPPPAESELPPAGPDAPPGLIAPADLAFLARRRPRAAHKGNYGHVLVIAGARGFTGAAIMAARAALRSGAGLVTVWTAGSIRAEIAAAVPEAMVCGLPENAAGSIGALDDPARSQLADAGKFSAALAGPGLTAHPDTGRLLAELLQSYCGPLVLDADALNVLSMDPAQQKTLGARRGAAVLTPHPGEMARLLQTTAATVQSDRFAAARSAVMRFNATVVLKGAGTLVAAPGAPLQVNLTGNPGMAKGGSGDVLAGLLAGLLAQTLPAGDAARAAVYLHGRAGDHAALQRTEAGFTAMDIIDCLPRAWAELSVR